MSGYLILIIDDEPLQRMVLEEYLQTAGYNVIQAENGIDGLKILEKQTPDLILLDVQMPKMDGFQTIDVIRKKDELNEVPVLFLTSQESHQHKVKGLESGADDYITKPFHKEELLARIKAVFRRIERHRRKTGGIEGDLTNISLSDLLLTMESESKTAAISLDDIDGKIFVENGSLVYVRQAEFTDDQAFTRIFLLEKGAFFVKFNALPAKIPRNPKSLRFTLISVLSHLELGTEDYIVSSPNREKIIRRIKAALMRTELRQGTEGIMKGDLSNISLADLLQSMENGSKTASISLEEIDAEIFIQDGLLILARQGDFTGEQALQRIFLLEKGAFSVRFDDLPAKIHDEPRGITGLLMNVMAEVDEIKDVIQRSRAENLIVKIEDNISEFPTIEKLKDQSPLRFTNLLVLMDGKLKENLSVLIAASKKGKIKKG